MGIVYFKPNFIVPKLNGYNIVISVIFLFRSNTKSYWMVIVIGKLSVVCILLLYG